jgi:hypothetical protein
MLATIAHPDAHIDTNHKIKSFTGYSLGQMQLKYGLHAPHLLDSANIMIKSSRME